MRQSTKGWDFGTFPRKLPEQAAVGGDWRLAKRQPVAGGSSHRLDRTELANYKADMDDGLSNISGNLPE